MLLDPTGRAVADIDLGEELAAVVGRAEWFGRANTPARARAVAGNAGVAEGYGEAEGRSRRGRHMQPICAPAAR